jgi:hypothetical protein
VGGGVLTRRPDKRSQATPTVSIDDREI